MIRNKLLSSSRRNFSTTPVNEEVWQETKNRQGKIYYVNVTTGFKTWDPPPSEAKLIKIPKIKLPEFNKLSERIYHFFFASTTAYYGLFAVCVAGLTYRVMFPPRPPAPTVGPVLNENK